jgi:hypothetical protein
MKLGLRAAMVFACCLVIAVPAIAGTFVNGGFEDGTFNGWTQGAGWWYGGWPLDPSTYLQGGSNYDISANASAIVSQGADPVVGNLLNQVYNGAYAARVNDWYNNYSVSVISQTVTNYTDPHIYFAWAAVLEASHGSTDSDNFTLKLTDDTTGAVLYAVTYDSYDNGPLFHTYGSWYYTDWQVQDLDVSTLQGHDFTLTLLGSDCPYGGHAGYVYLDGFGGTIPPPTTPEPGTLALLGTGTIFAANWLRRRLM